jgi:hypothetical protein
MKTRYASVYRGLLLAGFGLAAAHDAQSQNLNYTVSSASITAGSFSGLTLAGSTPIVVTDEDDDNSTAQNIGFTFNYNGQALTQFTLNTNGAIKLGATPLSGVLVDDLISSTDPADVNLIAPLNADILGYPNTAATSFRYLTTGTAPNRVCTVQWTNMTTFDTPRQFTDLTFQVKLYETSNVIEFVYGPLVPGTVSDNVRAEVGLKGSGNTPGQLVVASKATATPWASATFQNTLYTTQKFDYNISSLPTSGRIFRFTPTSTATHDAQLARALNLYPNPSAGQVTLEVRGANAQQGLRVEVSNLLGQRVYAGALRDNFTNQLDLSCLTNGLYTVKITRGNGYAISRLHLQH